MENRNTGVIYTTTGESRRSRIQSYHATQGWEMWKNKTKWKSDLRGMTPSEICDTVFKLPSNEGYESKFRIGFEVEKSYFYYDGGQGDSYGTRLNQEYELFRGFETDSSCGVEAITHILPLVPRGIWRTKVFDMMHKARHILDDSLSPSNGKCGGHICLSVDDMDTRELYKSVRKFSGIIMSLYRMRLYRTRGQNYCSNNMTMRTTRGTGWTNAGYTDSVCFNDRPSHTKYSFCKLSDKFIEFRVPPRVTSVECLRLRYELFYEVMRWAVKHQNTTSQTSIEVGAGIYTKFIRAVRPIILKMCNGESAIDNQIKADTICREARHFQRFIDTDGVKVAQVVKDFVLNTETVNRRNRIDGGSSHGSNARRDSWKRGEWV